MSDNDVISRRVDLDARRGQGAAPNAARGRLLYVWDAEYPWDVRTEKICRTLTDAGWDIHIAARNRSRRPTQETLREGTVHRMKPWRWAGRRLDSVSGFPAFFNPRWVSLLESAVRTVRPDVIVVRDLPLSPTAYFVGRRHSVPVVLDMAENYPAMAQDIWSAGRQRPWDILVRNPRLVSWVERWAVQHVDHILVVVDESADRLRQDYGVEAARLSVVSNTPPRARALQQPRSVRSLPGQPLEVVYLGIMEIPRGIGELLQAHAILRERGVACRLRLIGDGRDYEVFRQNAAELGLATDRVEFLGRLPYTEALKFVARADVGVVPHRADESWNTTIPNKLFDYMAAALPVVSSDATPCVRVLEETGAGVVYRSGDPVSLADALVAMTDPAARQRYSASGRSAIMDRYNWESDAARLHDALATVLRGKRRRAVQLERRLEALS